MIEYLRMKPFRLKSVLMLLAAILLLLIVLAGGLLYYMLSMPGRSPAGELPALTESQQALRNRLHSHVAHLAGEIGERNTEQPGSLEKSVAYLQSQLAAMQLAALRHEYQTDKAGSFANLEVSLYGTRRPEEILVIGAHYDSAWPSPGADDNASGVAVLLELARRLAEQRYDRTLRLVFFPNEESPHYGTERMGSKVYVHRASERGEDIIGMFSLEMLGYYDDTPGSQDFPRIIKPFYPDRGNFVAFVANLASRGLLHDAIGGFRQYAGMPAYGIAAPVMLVPDIRRSDHAMFWSHGYQAVMITDTAGFRNPHYHRHTDLPATLDYGRMARVVEGLAGAFADLATID